MIPALLESLWDDAFKGFAAAADSVGGNSLIERCQFAFFVNGQSQQEHVGNLSMCDERIGFEDSKDTDVLRPEAMTWRLTKPAQDVKHSRHIPRPVWVVRVAGNADKSIFGERTGCPGLLTLFHEPAMR